MPPPSRPLTEEDNGRRPVTPKAVVKSALRRVRLAFLLLSDNQGTVVLGLGTQPAPRCLESVNPAQYLPLHLQ